MPVAETCEKVEHVQHLRIYHRDGKYAWWVACTTAEMSFKQERDEEEEEGIHILEYRSVVFNNFAILRDFVIVEQFANITTFKITQFRKRLAD